MDSSPAREQYPETMGSTGNNAMEWLHLATVQAEC